MWCYRFWFFFDLIIFWARYVRLGAGADTGVPRPFETDLIALAVFHGAVFYTMAKVGARHSIGANSAFLLNFALSMLYVFVLFQQPEWAI